MNINILQFTLLVSLLLVNGNPPLIKSRLEKSNVASTSINNKDNLNISILLDLSDRISPKKNPNPTMNFYKRDLGYISSIAKGFENALRAKPIRQINDQIQVYFEPEPLNPAINSLANRLKLSFTKTSTTKQAINNIPLQYNTASSEIYNLALKDQKYVGSDIWGFFKNKVNDYCIKPNHRNILFILTDGYMFHKYSKFVEGPKSSYITPAFIKALKLDKSNYNDLITKKGFGFINANKDLRDLEIVVLGINSAKDNPYEREVIETYWSNWFKDMKVKRYMIKAADLPANLDPIIQKYLQ